jgi:hypothetical protein
MSYLSVWTHPVSLFEYSEPWYLLVSACQQNNIHIVRKLINQVNVSAFDLMAMVIYGNRKDMTTWKYIMKFLKNEKKEDATRTFQCYEKTTHTLLSYLCFVIQHDQYEQHGRYDHLDIAKQKITSLLELGCRWDQEIDQKTPLSYLILFDEALPLLSWCINQKGANPHCGHLLVYASNGITKKQHMERVDAWKESLEQQSMVERERELVQKYRKYKPYKNKLTFTYLLELGLDVEDCIDSGMTPFLAACSEGSLYKVQRLLEKGVSIYKKTKEGVDAWFWADIHYLWEPWSDDASALFLRNTLQQHERIQKQFWTSILDVVEVTRESMLQDVPFQELLQVLAKV